MNYLTFGLLFAAFYMPISLPLPGGWFLPNLPAILLGILALPSARQDLYRIVIVLGLLASYCVVNGVFAMAVVTPMVERIKGSMQLIYFSGLSMLIAASDLFRSGQSRKSLGRVFLSLGLMMVCVGYLEDKTIIGGISDRFRDAVYGGGSLYVDDKRDIVLSSAIRPKVFASEPAAAATGTCICLTLGGVFLMRLVPLVVACIGCLVAASIFASPIPMAFSITIFVGAIPSWNYGRRPGSQTSLLLNQVLALVAGALLLVSAVVFVETLHKRFIMAIDGQDRSSYLRLFHLFFVAGDAMRENPLFATGIGGEMEVADSLFVEGTETAKSQSMLNNPPGTILLFGGITASVLAVVAALNIAARVALHQKVLFGLFIGSVMLSGGSIVNTAAWITGGVLFGALRGINQNAFDQGEQVAAH